MNFDNETTFTLTFIEIFESSINIDKLLFDENVNFEKKKLNAKTQYHFLNYINDDDQKFISEQTIAKEI